MTHYQRQLDHLITLAKIDGWKAYAWARAKELEMHQSGLWAGISKDLERTMLSLKSLNDQQRNGV